jgi:hypothetical protein
MSEAHISVEAPSKVLGFLLTLRLHGHGARVEELAGGWRVEIDPGVSQEWVVDCVRRWLDEESLPEVIVHIDGESYTVARSGTLLS